MIFFLIQANIKLEWQKVAKILVIDDDKSIRELLRTFLESRGHEVLEADDGSLGIEMVRSDSYDLVVIDMVMPKRGGMETIMELCQATPELPVIAMSGKIPTAVRPINSLVRQFGVRDILQKPFTRNSFFEAIDSALTAS